MGLYIKEKFANKTLAESRLKLKITSQFQENKFQEKKCRFVVRVNYNIERARKCEISQLATPGHCKWNLQQHLQQLKTSRAWEKIYLRLSGADRAHFRLGNRWVVFLLFWLLSPIVLALKKKVKMETIHHLVLWILVACHHTWSAQQGKNMLPRATTVSFVPGNEQRKAKHASKGFQSQTSKS